MKLSLLLLIIFLGSKVFALSCYGTEPFWNAEINNDKISIDFTGIQSELKISKISVPLGMQNAPESSVRVYSNSKGPLATVFNQRCNDGMSDNEFLKGIIIFTPSGSLYGCCGKSL